MSEKTSPSSRYTTISRLSSKSLSSTATRKRAKAEALKASLKLAENQAQLEKRKAELALQHALTEKENAVITAEMTLLNIKREALELEVEAKILEGEEKEDSIRSSLAGLEVENPQARTNAFVQNVSQYYDEATANNRTPGPHPAGLPTNQQQHEVPSLSVSTSHDQLQMYGGPELQRTEHISSELTKFLLKKDLLLSRLTTFNDKAEFYPTWKNSFRTIMCELEATPSEEIDLLLKWTGPLSHRHIMSIKAANSNNPSQALHKGWLRLDERFGCPEMIESALKAKLDSFQALSIKEPHRLYDLSDILDEIEAIKEDIRYSCLLSYFDSSSGVTPIVKKLPSYIQGKWTNEAVTYMTKYGVSFPPFKFFTEFIRKQAKIRNNPSFAYGADSKTDNSQGRHHGHVRNRTLNVTSRKTNCDNVQVQSDSSDRKCPLHGTFHSLNKCKAFRLKPLDERKKFLRDHNICFKCCDSRSHRRRDCTVQIQCDECDSTSHPSALHVKVQNMQNNGGESQHSRTHDGQEAPGAPDNISSKCTQICGQKFSGKSCSKTILVKVFSKDDPQRVIVTYAVIDDQSNRSLVSPRFFDHFHCQANSTIYTLSSCGGTINTTGRKISDFVVESLDGSCSLDLPTLIECEHVPNIREEIPTPEVALHYSHLKDIANCIPSLDPDAEILLLLGRDIIAAHHVIDQRIGKGNEPYGQRLRLGWTIIGETCLGKTHTPPGSVNTYKTHILGSGRLSLLLPCTNEFRIQEDTCMNSVKYGVNHRDTKLASESVQSDNFGRNVFRKTKDDDKPGLSVDDHKFLRVMDQGFQRDDNGNWVAPLPFRSPRQRLANNRSAALRRAKLLEASLKRDSLKREHFLTFMDGILKNGHAELAPQITQEEECWFLPIFGVYHPRKPNQLRAVFDSSAKHEGLSLNDVLLTGPDFTNSLLGVLVRFRKEPIAIMGDVRQMFYCFKVREDHRNFLRFFWFSENNPELPMTEYRMTVHVFGNRPSPAVATYGIRKSILNAKPEYGQDVADFVIDNFYVDDGLTSLPTAMEAIDLMKRTQKALMSEGNLRLHKIASNSKEVLSAFAPDDLAKDVTGLEFGVDELPNQRSLGLNWNLDGDTFFFDVIARDTPSTRRGILSHVNSIFDPLGFLSPVIIEGKSILRNLVLSTFDWDTPLSLDQVETWEQWKDSLVHLRGLQIPRTYSPACASLISCVNKSIHIFCDASELAIAAVGYIKMVSQDNINHIGFVLGKCKLAPTHGHSIPRLELCAAVLAVEVGCSIADHLKLPIEDFSFYSDSKVVLGYIFNTTRRFYTYVTNRVSFIRKETKPEQWRFISTEKNPADQGTRPLPAHQLKDSVWLKGPAHLLTQTHEETTNFAMVEPDADNEVRPHVTCLKTTMNTLVLNSHYFSKFSTWRCLVRSFALLRHIVRSYAGLGQCVGWHYCSESRTVEAKQAEERFIIQTVQKEAYLEEMDHLKQGKPLSHSSALLSLDVFLDLDGILRVGGRLNRSDIPRCEVNPILIPGKHHIATLLVRHFHELAKHQGRNITSASVRNAGYWITGCKRLISSVLYKCVKCRKLRGKFACQKMANLPPDRVEPGPPFTYIGIDTFGPWEVVTRKTRGGVSNSKRWAILFTCLVCRGVHIEVVEEMSSSSFINAFKRFVALRGNVKQVRSDRGTNFVGATDDLGIHAVNVEDGPVKDYLNKSGTVWLFNPPHSSHFGGVWERLIGVTKGVLNSMLTDLPHGGLTHEVLTTFLAEASAIVNSRPLVPISSDPDDPIPLSPSLILTSKPDTTVNSVSVDRKELYRSQWKRVQHLSNTFWKRWRTQYLQTVQNFKKWQTDQRNLAVGDIVLLKDHAAVRNSWPMGRVNKIFPSDDGKIRKVEVMVCQRGHSSFFMRPVNELIVLVCVE